MPRASNGQYLPPANTAAVSGNTISSTAYNSLTGDIGNEITNSLDRGGRSAMTAALPMGGFPINNLATPSNSTDAATKAYVDIAMPSGAVMSFAMSTAPSGWLICDGSAVSRTAYAALYAAIGSTWGAGDGSTTFNIPDFRGAFLRGFDNGRGYDTGRVFASYEADAFASHNHSVSDPGHSHVVVGAAINGTGSGNTVAGALLGVTNATTTAATTGISIASTGGAETRPKNYAIQYCIKV